MREDKITSTHLKPSTAKHSISNHSLMVMNMEYGTVQVVLAPPTKRGINNYLCHMGICATCLGLLFMICAVNNSSRRFLQSTTTAPQAHDALTVHTVPRVRGTSRCAGDTHALTKAKSMAEWTRIATCARQTPEFHVTRVFSPHEREVIIAVMALFAFGLFFCWKRGASKPKLCSSGPPSGSPPSPTMAMASTTGSLMHLSFLHSKTERGHLSNLLQQKLRSCAFQCCGSDVHALQALT